ncbi:MAG: ferrous iron transporter B, partial [Deltaproteobacteria bacterium]
TLGIPVVATVAREGAGVGSVVRSLARAKLPELRARIPERILKVLGQYEVDAEKLHMTEGKVWLALQLPWLVPQLVDSIDDLASRKRLELALAALEQDRQALSVHFVTEVLDKARELAESVTEARQAVPSGWSERLTRLTRRPVTAVPIAIVVLALVYLFVGKLGAEVLVDLLEGDLFGGLVIPWLSGLIDRLGVPIVKDLLVGQFGLVSVGITLSFGIVLPVLATFFVAFSILEDSGYLPRLSLLADRGLRRLGLTGKAVLPLVMGFSCITMAVLTTRMLETKKQRIIATALLVLTVPCAPLLSVMLVALGRLKWTATAVVALVLVVQLLLVGVLANMLLPGRRPELVMELPRLHAPQLRNVLVRSGHSLVWFMKEALPYFLLGTLGLFLLDKAGGLDWLRHVFEPVSVRLLGLPAESADAFLMTIVRREAGAALLVSQLDMGLYGGPQVVVALVVMTVMLPCINTLLVMVKERGVAVSAVLLVVSISLAVAEGTLLNWLLGLSGATF